MQHAGQAEPEQADRIFSGQKSAQAVTQGQTGLSGSFPADISVKELPGFQPLLPAVIPEAIDVGLPGRILPDVCSVFPVELMNGRSSCGRCQLSGWSTQVSPWFRCALTAIHQSYRMCPSHSWKISG